MYTLGLQRGLFTLFIFCEEGPREAEFNCYEASGMGYTNRVT